AFLLALSGCNAQDYKITFKVNMMSEQRPKTVGLKGNIAPLDWNKEYPMTDIDGDGIYETTITFNTAKRNLRYTYTADGHEELQGADKRITWFKAQPQTVVQIFNEYSSYDDGKIEKLNYSGYQIQEDVKVLREAITYIHPNLYKYRDSLLLERDFEELEAEMLANPTLTNAYKTLSRFTTKIKCSHTFTNPWNQGPDIKRAIFFQADKLPFSFKRIGKQIFVDKNATENGQLQYGHEILSIDSVPAQEVMTRLATYITSDGNNYEKRLQRLTLSGSSKFELFDIFYPLEFGRKDSFRLKLKNHLTGDTLITTVKAISKTRRNALFMKKYTDYGSSFENGWDFKLLKNKTAYLKMESFAVFSTDFDWKSFINNAFETIRSEKIENLVIDIRGNEGGDTVVAEYIMERIISDPITIEIPANTTRYRKIPEALKSYISTWDKKPYDWGKKLKYIGNGRYKLKNAYAATGQTFKPEKNNFDGSVYLLVNAENSSATHIMATYAKKYKLATLVGQETGGNQKGLNGGYMFFLRLPNSRIEVDIPVFGIQILKETDETYDGGVRPDILVKKNIPDLVNGVDTEMQKVFEMIEKKNK
ncbi:MAG: S41 family peptidase, partial [Bacteroidota bacterium]